MGWMGRQVEIKSELDLAKSAVKSLVVVFIASWYGPWQGFEPKLAGSSALLHFVSLELVTEDVDGIKSLSSACGILSDSLSTCASERLTCSTWNKRN